MQTVALSAFRTLIITMPSLKSTTVKYLLLFYKAPLKVFKILAPLVKIYFKQVLQKEKLKLFVVDLPKFSPTVSTR